MSKSRIKKNIQSIIDDKVRALMLVPDDEFKRDHGTLLKLLTDSLKSLNDIPDDPEVSEYDEMSEEELMEAFKSE